MKKVHVIFGLLIVAMLTMFMECGDDEALGPALQLYGGAFIDSDETVPAGAVLSFSWHATKGDAKLESMTISREGNALVGWNEKEIPNSENESYTDTALLEAPLNEGAYTYALIVTDKDALTATQSVVITVVDALSTEVTDGEIGHLYGPLNGAWDLVNDVEMWMADPDANKDMVNTSSASGSAFEAGWEAGTGNSTTFVKDNSFDYDNAYAQDAEDAFNAGTPSNEVSDASENDIYIARLRGGDNYAVIKITDIDPYSKSTMAGDGKLTFTYKK